MTASKTPAAPDVTLRQSARWLPADMDTPISLFLGMCHEHHGIPLESAEVDGRWGRYSILACDFLLQAACRDGLLALDTNDDRLRPFAVLNGMPFTEGLRTLMCGLHLEKPEGITLPPITRALYGYFGYGMASFFNKKLENCLPQKDADASLVLPGTVLVFDHLYNRLCQISLGEHRDVNGARTRECGAALPFIGEDAVTATPGREGYMDAVNKIKQMLRQGEAIQVVPSCPGSARRSRETPSPCTAGCAAATPRLICSSWICRASPCSALLPKSWSGATKASSSSPHRRDPQTRSRRSRRRPPRRRAAGRSQGTRRARHAGQYGPQRPRAHSPPGTVNVERLMEVERFSHVMHLTSRIAARLRPRSRCAGRAGGDLPGGRRSAARPKPRAMEIIAETEQLPARPLRGLASAGSGSTTATSRPRCRHHRPQHVGKGWKTPLAGGRRHRLRLRPRRRME